MMKAVDKSAYALFAIVIGACLWWVWRGFYDHDEIEHLHAAWLVSQGALPYRDFLEQHHPLLWYLLAPFVRLFSSPHLLVVAMRCVGMGLLGLFSFVVSRILQRVVPGAPSRWVLLLLLCSFLFTTNSLEVRPDPLMNLLFFSGLLAWISFLEQPRLSRAAITGIAFGLSAAVLQKAFVIEAAALLATAMICLRCRKDRQRVRKLIGGTGIAVLMAAVVLTSFAAWVAHAGIWDDFFFWNYTFNRVFYLQADIAEHFSAIKVFWRSILQDPALWIAGVAGAVLLARDLWRRRRSLAPSDDARILLFLLTIVYSAFLAFNRFPYAQYFIVLIPLVAIFAGRALAACEGRRWRWVAPVAGAAMVAEFAILVAAFETNQEQRVVQERVLQETTPAETIFVPPPRHPIFRRDGAYFWFNARLIGDLYRRECAEGRCMDGKLALEEERWRQTPPAFVFLDPREPSTHPFRWEEHAADYLLTAMDDLYWRR